MLPQWLTTLIIGGQPPVRFTRDILDWANAILESNAKANYPLALNSTTKTAEAQTIYQ